MPKVLKTRQFATIKENLIDSVSLHLASAEDVLEWTHGEVIKPETINYKSYKPEKGGLFDEVIFGPTTDYKCPICGTKYKRSNEGQVCEKTDDCKIIKPEILPRSSRRTRMGHISLASPVTHFWFFKIDHSIITKLLGLKPVGTSKLHSKKAIEDLIYFKAHMVVETGGYKSVPRYELIEINKAAVTYRNILNEILQNYKKDTEAYQEISLCIETLEEMASSKIGKDYGVDFYELNEVIEEYSDVRDYEDFIVDVNKDGNTKAEILDLYSKMRIMTGTAAIEYLLENLDISREIKNLKAAIRKVNKDIAENISIANRIIKRNKLYKRLDVLYAFKKSGQKPTDMLIKELPVVPADLRPLVQIEGGRHSTSDVNELYRRIIIRNNRLKKWYELDAPMLIIQNELRMLQDAVDALIDNARKKPTPVLSKDNRPLKSLSESLVGKKGRFRQNLLGKRVDYSGRSVIVVGPTLKMHQAGIPRNMAAKLFEPWIVKALIEKELASSIKIAKNMIDEFDVRIWPIVEETIKGKVVLLNRAPTLHRLSVQAFEPVLVRGQAIRLHPLVTTAFNADFDGDQMAVHVPIAPEAIREAKELMLANKNILGPKDGEPIINPSQDMILGLFYLTKEIAGAKGEGQYFATFDEAKKAYDRGYISLHARIAIPVKNIDKDALASKNGYAITTYGKFLLNKAFPANFPFISGNEGHNIVKDKNSFIAPLGINLKEYISKLKINKSLTKKEIATIARTAFDNYVAAISKGDVAEVLKEVNTSNYRDNIMKFHELIDYKGEKLNKIHSQILDKIVKERFEEINTRIALENEGVERTFEVHERVELLEKVWFDYTNVVANILDNIKQLGFDYSTISGITMSIDDIKPSPIKHSIISDGHTYISKLKEMTSQGLITDAERYRLTIKKWTEIKEDIQDNLKDITKEHPNNPIFMMMESGARGNISNFSQLAGMRGLMANNQKIRSSNAKNESDIRSVVEVPILSSFLEGLTSYEFYSSTHGARKGLTDTALSTADSGYLTRRLVDVAQNIVVKEDDCGSDQGFLVKDIIDTRTGTIIVPLLERIEGRFANTKVVDANGEVIIERNELITPEIAKKIVKSVKEVSIRSVLGCQTKEGVCKRCYGKDLATNRIVANGEAVGILSAQSIGEPGTQLTMRTFHTGGVAGGSDFTGGFQRLKELIDVTSPWGKKSIISKAEGVVKNITPYIDSEGKETNKLIVTVESKLESEKPHAYRFNADRRLRVKEGDKVKRGQKIVDGPIDPYDLLEVAGPRVVQNYLLKEIQRLYRMQGISISDKYIEIILRQILSKIVIQDPGDSDFFAGNLVDIHDYRDESQKLLVKGKRPPYGQVVIKGVKAIPLLSSSFLAAASYQETAKVLVHASIAGKQDTLSGLKENIIVGHQIPVGTASSYEKNGKYDIKNARSYFSKK